MEEETVDGGLRRGRKGKFWKGVNVVNAGQVTTYLLVMISCFHGLPLIIWQVAWFTLLPGLYSLNLL